MIRRSRLLETALLCACLVISTLGLRAEPEKQPSADSLAALSASLKWQTGAITLKDNLARINLSSNFRFLDHENAEKVLHDIWGNPADPNTLGMIFPADVGPLDKNGWGVVITYEDGGYVKDTDADQINYADLLKQMQEGAASANEEREKAGYPTINLVGWAAPPRYDKTTHKLYWAKDIKFGNDPEDTLNYNIRVLGRRGVLVLNAVASMNDFPAIEKQMPEVISMVDFQPGNQYADFDPKVDKIAEYGLAALVAGGALGAAAKLGLLGLLWKYIILAVVVLKKAILVVIIAIGAGIKKLMSVFKGKTENTDHLLPPPPPKG